MKAASECPRALLTDIRVNRGERQRRNLDPKRATELAESIAVLADSIREFGVLEPIILEGTQAPFRLMAGERRFEASKLAGLPDIPYIAYTDLSPIDRILIELEENVRRADLSWQDRALTVGRFHEAAVAENPEWTITDTANRLRFTRPLISKYLDLYKIRDSVYDDQGTEKRIFDIDDYNVAYNKIKREKARAQGSTGLMEAIMGVAFETHESTPEEFEHFHLALDVTGASSAPVNGSTPVVAPAPQPIPVDKDHAGPKLSILSPNSSILHESFLQWAPRYRGATFNFLHCDFPYGIKAFTGPQSGKLLHDTYKDDPDIYWALLDCLLDNLEHIMSISAHIMFWYSEKNGPRTRELFAARAPRINWYQHPLIWHKTDGSGISSVADQRPRHVYETCMFGTAQGRQIVQIVDDVYGCPSDNSLHVSAKPEPMLRHFMRMLVDKHTDLLDPTCGSGAALRAAESLSARRVLGMDVDEACVGRARNELKNSRIKLAGHKAVKNILQSDLI